MTQTNTNTYLWCDACRRSYRHHETRNGACPVCDRMTRPIGKYQAIVRGLMSNELATSEIYTKHRQIIRMIWTRNGMGEQYYRALGADISYNRFEARVTDLLCRGAREGWVSFEFPPAPTGDDATYRMEFDDEARFIDELTREFAEEIPSDA
ncbi:MAG TPA: hypothetical protein VGR22_06590 [Thermomicrobiales bacterium]|nr:hypothetical protein [Thermomicrobiales bacterium]